MWIVFHCQPDKTLTNIHMCIFYVKSQSLNELVYDEAMLLLEKTIVYAFINRREQYHW